MVEIVTVVGGVLFMGLIAFGPGAFRQSHTVNAEGAGQLGSFVGGLAGAIFALIGVALLYSTLTSQRRAVAQQSFENKYFELIKLHRENVAEIDLQGSSGRKLFVLLLRELRCLLDIVREIAKTHAQLLNQRDALHLAYYCLFFGVGPNSSRMLKMSLPTLNVALVGAVEDRLNKAETKMKTQQDRGFGYLPFEGHQSRLGHYYRHLYQLVRYVDRQTMFDTDQKYEYMKTIRAQLSTHEQALLLVNSLTPIGRDWWDKGNLITRYRLVQNIPRGFFDSGELDLGKLFAPGYFEWEEQ